MRLAMLRPHDPQRCPADQALLLIGGKWKPMLLWRLSRGAMRHSQLLRALPGVSQRMLTLHLRELERDGLLTISNFSDRRGLESCGFFFYGLGERVGRHTEFAE